MYLSAWSRFPKLRPQTSQSTARAPLPRYSKWTDQAGSHHPTSDFGNSGMKTGGGAFEWHTVPAAGLQTDDGKQFIRIPKMRMGLNSAGRTVLMTGFKSWKGNSAELHDPLEATLSGASSTLDEEALLPLTGGTTHSCPASFKYRRTDLKLSYDGNQLDFGGTIHTAQEGSECVAAVQWDATNKGSSCADGKHCAFAEVFQIKKETIVKGTDGAFTVVPGSMEPVESIPASMATADTRFPGAGNKLYDRQDASELCAAPLATTKDGTESLLYCRQSKAGDWMGWYWYKFTEQPGIQRLNLSPERKAFMQARVERLHTAMAKNAPLNDWLKRPSSDTLPPLVKVDSASLVTPPCGLEVGYVPIVVYQGMSPHTDCNNVATWASDKPCEGGGVGGAPSPVPATAPTPAPATTPPEAVPSPEKTAPSPQTPPEAAPSPSEATVQPTAPSPSAGTPDGGSNVGGRDDGGQDGTPGPGETGSDGMHDGNAGPIIGGAAGGSVVIIAVVVAVIVMVCRKKKREMSASEAASPSSNGSGGNAVQMSNLNPMNTSMPNAIPVIPGAQAMPSAAPRGWSAVQDPKTGETYYLNQATGVTQWERPEGPSGIRPTSSSRVVSLNTVQGSHI